MSSFAAVVMQGIGARRLAPQPRAARAVCSRAATLMKSGRSTAACQSDSPACLPPKIGVAKGNRRRRRGPAALDTRNGGFFSIFRTQASSPERSGKESEQRHCLHSGVPYRGGAFLNAQAADLLYDVCFAGVWYCSRPAAGSHPWTDPLVYTYEKRDDVKMDTESYLRCRFDLASRRVPAKVLMAEQ